MIRPLQDTSVLLLEDAAELREQLSRVLTSSQQGFNVEAIPSTGTVMRKLTMGKYHILLVDYDLAVGTAAAVVRTANEIDPELPVVVFSRSYDDRVFGEVKRMGADTYVPLTEISIRMMPDILEQRIETRTAIRDAVDSKNQSVLKSHELEILASLVRKMVETNDLKSVMQEMAEQIVKRLNMKVVALQRFFPAQKGFATFGIYPRGKLVKFAESVFGISLDSFVFPFDPDKCVVDRYTVERKPWVGNDFAEVFGPTMPAQAARMIQKFARVKSIYNAPFYGKDRLLGGIVVGNVRNSFTDVELEAFDAIVHVSSLLFEYNDSVKSQTIHAERLKAVREAVSLLRHEYSRDGGSPERAGTLETFQQKLLSAVPADMVGFFVHDSAKNALVERRIFGRRGRHSGFPPSVIHLNTDGLGEAVAAGHAFLENNFESALSAGRPSRSGGYGNILAVPVKRNTDVEGMILLTRSVGNPFVESDREVAELFACQFDIALLGQYG